MACQKMKTAGKLLAGPILMVAFICALSAPAASAQHAESMATQADDRQFSSKSGAVVIEAQTLMSSNQYGAAISKLNEAMSMDLNPHERSTTLQIMGSAYYEMDNYEQAIISFEGAINAGGLLPKEAIALRLNIAQLLIAEGRNAEGALRLEQYFIETNTDNPQYIEALIIHFIQIKDYRRALPWAENWFNAADRTELKHFEILNLIYSELRMAEKQEGMIKQMLQRFPGDRALWKRWASLLSNDGREDDAFAVMKMMYLSGMLEAEDDIMRVVQYYSHYGMPYHAAQLLWRELNAKTVTKNESNLTRLSDLLQKARECDPRPALMGARFSKL